MIQSVRGFRDISGAEAAAWENTEALLRRAFSTWGFEELRLPLLEKTELFKRGIGDETDIVEKEMYTFADKGGELVTMRPEGTASVIRMFNEHKLYGTDRLFKFFYLGPMFRYERPQKGRLRQFHQAGVEFLGDPSPNAEVELLSLAVDILETLGIEGCELKLNSLGCAGCRKAFREALLAFVVGKEDALCDDCRRRRVTNPLRLLDCKSEGCREAMGEAPSISAFICSDCRSHFEALMAALRSCEISFVSDPSIVRGLDYYNRTVFEIHAAGLGAQSALLAGGRYDGLSASLGGYDIAAAGWALGFERLASLLPAGFGERSRSDVFVLAAGEAARMRAMPLVRQLRRVGLRTEYDPFGGSMKSQFRRADKLGCVKVVIIGDDELKDGVFVLKDMASGEQRRFGLDVFTETVRRETENLIMSKGIGKE